MTERADIVVVGGGPGGYLAALRGAQLKKRIILVEEDRVGGTCINRGCIPTKFLLHQTRILREIGGAKTLDGPASEIRLNWKKAQAEKQAIVDKLVKGIVFLLGKGGVEIVKGAARLREARSVVVRTADGERILEAGRIIVATGSRAASLPFLRPDGRTVITSTEALDLTEVPKSLLVVGAGAIGLEIGSIFSRLGTEVTVLEIMPQVLPGGDRESVSRLERVFRRQGLKVHTEMRIEEAGVERGIVTLKGLCLKTGSPFEYRAETVLLAAGRTPNTEDLFEGAPFLEMDRGFIRVGPSLETGVSGIYAIGDVIGGKLLAHKAYHDGVVAAENAAGLESRVDYAALPMAVFTEPEFASVGLTEDEAVGMGVKIRTGVFPLQASGRALTMDSTDGLVKIVADGNDRVVGAHLVAPGASDLIPVLTMAVRKGMTIRDLASLIYVHPSISEAVGEAALKAGNEALHILNT